VKWYNLGEWLPPGKLIPDEMVHTFVLWNCADITSRAAGILGMSSDEARFRSLADRTRKAFQARFFDPAVGTYGDAGGNILALKMGVPPDQYVGVVAALKSDILKNGGHLDTGILGTRFFFEVLADNGLNELAFEAMNKRTEPSYGHWIELGSTTTRENWNEEGSHNHPMFGGGLVWFYRNLAGMQADPLDPGYRHIIFRPQPVKELEYVTYTSNTPYGKGGITWRNETGALLMEITVPVSCRASVYVPAEDPSQITESGTSTDLAEGVTFKEMKDGYALFEIESGNYVFRVSEPI
jgi:alpha-L-rhamnosidase